VEEDEVEAGFRRTNRAQDYLLRLEWHMRHFLAGRLQEAFGSQWIKQRVPEGVRLSWEAKRAADRAKGEPEGELFEYAYLGDCVTIILRKDNWNEVFQPVFRHSESVQESFRRLHPIRNRTSHGRTIMPDDELYLYVEAKRLLKSIGVDI